MNDLRENPIAKKRRIQSMIIASVFLLILTWVFSSGSWGEVGAKFSRFWLFDSGQ